MSGRPSIAGAHAPTITRSVAFRTLGCKLNQCETAQMEEALAARGYSVVPWDGSATFRVINTCTVTAKTDRTCRHEIRRAMRRDPGTLVAVTGCYAQVAPEKVASIPGVSLVLGNLDKARLADHLAGLGTTRTEPITSVTPYHSDGGGRSVFEGEAFTHFSGYTRAFLKVQNGCDSSCSYCVIPAARGPSRSMRLDSVLAQVRLLAGEGYREVVLTGIHLGAWGRDTGEGSLATLLQALAGDAAVERYRLSSTEPMEVDDQVLAVMREANGRFADHFHVPLQSGSDEILRAMHRPYSALQYARRVRAIRDAFPDAAIGADVIVGYPGETDQHFEETVALVREVPLTYLHVFAYSDRPGTRASEAASKTPPEVIDDRSRRLRALGSQKRREFEQAFTGRELKALVLKQTSSDGRLVALTGNYLEVLVNAEQTAVNTFVRVRPERPHADGGWEGSICAP